MSDNFRAQNPSKDSTQISAQAPAPSVLVESSSAAIALFNPTVYGVQLEPGPGDIA